jgi:hypothetical protein
MTKTPEQMAEEYIENFKGDQATLGGKIGLSACRLSFLAGYKAAQDHIADASKKVDDHDTSYQQGYLDGVADTQARAVKEDK